MKSRNLLLTVVLAVAQIGNESLQHVESEYPRQPWPYKFNHDDLIDKYVPQIDNFKQYIRLQYNLVDEQIHQLKTNFNISTKHVAQISRIELSIALKKINSELALPGNRLKITQDCINYQKARFLALSTSRVTICSKQSVIKDLEIRIESILNQLKVADSLVTVCSILNPPLLPPDGLEECIVHNLKINSKLLHKRVIDIQTDIAEATVTFLSCLSKYKHNLHKHLAEITERVIQCKTEKEIRTRNPPSIDISTTPPPHSIIIHPARDGTNNNEVGVKLHENKSADIKIIKTKTTIVNVNNNGSINTQKSEEHLASDGTNNNQVGVKLHENKSADIKINKTNTTVVNVNNNRSRNTPKSEEVNFILNKNKTVKASQKVRDGEHATINNQNGMKPDENKSKITKIQSIDLNVINDVNTRKRQSKEVDFNLYKNKRVEAFQKVGTKLDGNKKAGVNVNEQQSITATPNIEITANKSSSEELNLNLDQNNSKTTVTNGKHSTQVEEDDDEIGFEFKKQETNGVSLKSSFNANEII